MANPDAFAAVFDAVTENIGHALVGKADAIKLSLVCLAAEGHLLIEDVPGVGKTTLAKAMAASFASDWNRIQFTPDLLPSDVTGVTVFSRTGNRFEFRFLARLARRFVVKRTGRRTAACRRRADRQFVGKRRKRIALRTRGRVGERLRHAR